MKLDCGRTALGRLGLRCGLVFALLSVGALSLVGQGGGGGTTTRVSVSSAGIQGSNDSYHPSINADGRYVAFNSYANNLVAGDTNGSRDTFVHDRLNGTTTRVSVSSQGSQGNSSSDDFYPSISADGRYVAFSSAANNLVSGDTNGTYDTFVHDRQTGTTALVSVSSNGNQGNSRSDMPSISADGRYVAFSSTANNLVAGDTNGWQDTFVHDQQNGATTRVSVSSNASQGNNSSDSYQSISADGRYVAFHSSATNLVAGDTNGSQDTFVHDRLNGTTTRVSVSSDGNQGNALSHDPISVSADGRYVAFNSSATNLVAGDTNGRGDTFVHDRLNGTTTRVSVSSDGGQGNNFSHYPSISGDGRYVAFHSQASNLVSGDTNGFPDVFVHDRGIGGTSPTLSIDPSSIAGGGFAVGTVTLSQTTFANTTYTLSSSNTAVAQVPASVTIPALSSTAQFAITTKAVAANQTVTITATGNGTATASLLVSAAPIINAGAMVLMDGVQDNNGNWVGRQVVKGILCDNFRETPSAERNRLLLRMNGLKPPILTGVGYVTTFSGTPLSAAKGGTIEIANNEIQYFPPTEYNQTENPTLTGQLDRSPTRTIYVRVQFKDTQGRWYRTDPAPVVIARPPMVLVHGINNDSTNWKQFALNLRSYGAAFPFMAPDHGGISEPFFHGRGTVEGAASSVKAGIDYVLTKIRTGRPWNPDIIEDPNETWDDPYTAYATVGPLAAKRVDIVAHSYGGVIARWLIADHNSDSARSADWYLRRGLSGFDTGPQLGKDGGKMVRKLITLGSMWRGTPVANLANEISLGGDGGYGDAPFDLLAFADIRSFFRTMPPLQDERYPAFQVMAVESPWLRYLNLGVFPNSSNLIPKSNFPFRQSVGYASIAGDDSDYLGFPGLNGDLDFSLFGKVDEWQQPSWFPYLGLEEAVQQQKNYSDGIVPVWSAAIPGSYQVFPVDHDDLITDVSVISRTMLWLNSQNMKSGKELTMEWESSAPWPRSSWPRARGDNYQWIFPSTGHMAPWPQRLAYTAGSALKPDNVTTRFVGRLNTTYATGDYLNPKFQVLTWTPTSVTIRFNAAAGVTSISGSVFRLPSVWAAGIPVTSYAIPVGPGQITVSLNLDGTLPAGSYYVILAWHSDGVHGSAKVGASITSQTFTLP